MWGTTPTAQFWLCLGYEAGKTHDRGQGGGRNVGTRTTELNPGGICPDGVAPSGVPPRARLRSVSHAHLVGPGIPRLLPVLTTLSQVLPFFWGVNVA